MRKGKIVTRNFSFSHNVFHSFISLAHQDEVLCGNWLKPPFHRAWLTYFCFVVCNCRCSVNLRCSFNPFPKQALVFTCLQYKSFENTRGAKEKLLVTSNFSFSHSVFCLFESLLPFQTNFKLLSPNSFSSEESKILHLRKG